MQQSQRGFTLIEITIVLVVIGLLLGGVIKGQELINSAKIKNLSSDFKNIPLYIYGYQDKFRALPGDDKTATTNVAASANGDGDGIIDGNWNDSPTAQTPSEAISFWQVVRLANLSNGSTSLSDANYLPQNTLGGKIGIQSGTSDVSKTPIKDGQTTPQAIRGDYIICSANIPGNFVKQLDKNLDDGNSASGSMLAGVATAAGTPMAAVANIDDTTSYTVCMGV